MTEKLVVINQENELNGFEVAIFEPAWRDGLPHFNLVSMEHRYDLNAFSNGGGKDYRILATTECVVDLFRGEEASHFDPTNYQNGGDAVGEWFLGETLLVGRANRAQVQQLPGESAFTDVSCWVSAIRTGYAKELLYYRLTVALILTEDRQDLIVFRGDSLIWHEYMRPKLDGIPAMDASNLALNDPKGNWRTTKPDFVLIVGGTHQQVPGQFGWIVAQTCDGAVIEQFDSNRLFSMPTGSGLGPGNQNRRTGVPIKLAGAAYQLVDNWGCDLKQKVLSEQNAAKPEPFWAKVFKIGKKRDVKQQAVQSQKSPITRFLENYGLPFWMVTMSLLLGGFSVGNALFHESKTSGWLQFEKRREEGNAKYEAEARMYRARIEATNERKVLINKVVQSRIAVQVIMKAVYDLVPSGVVIDSLLIKDRQVTVNGFVTNATASQAPPAAGADPAAPPDPNFLPKPIDVAGKIEAFSKGLGQSGKFSPPTTKFDEAGQGGKLAYKIVCSYVGPFPDEPVFREPIPAIIEQAAPVQPKTEEKK